MWSEGSENEVLDVEADIALLKALTSGQNQDDPADEGSDGESDVPSNTSHVPSVTPTDPIHNRNNVPLPPKPPPIKASLPPLPVYDFGGQWINFLNQSPVGNKELSRDVSETLFRNRELQEILHEKLLTISHTLEANERLRRKLAKLIISQRRNRLASKRRNGFSCPYFQDEDGKVPLPNPDALTRRANLNRRPANYKHRPWISSELRALHEGVCQQNLEMMMRPVMIELEKLVNDRLVTNNTSLRPQIEALQKELHTLRSQPLDSYADNLHNIDWVKLWRFKPDLRKRSPDECRIQWTNVSHPIVNNEKWSKKEDIHILELATASPHPNWAIIAESLGTYRTPAACFRRYQRSLNPILIKCNWKEDEDESLKVAVLEFGPGNWREMRRFLPGRTGQQLLHRWKAIDPSIRKGRWTKEDDRLLLLAVEKYGVPNWRSISVMVPHRTDAQCRERYSNVLSPDVPKRVQWTPEEDERLSKMAESCTTANGISWAMVAAHMGSRTDSQCWRRWKRINKGLAQKYFDNLVRKKNALPRARRHSGLVKAVDLPDEVVRSIDGLAIRTPTINRSKPGQQPKKRPGRIALKRLAVRAERVQRLSYEQIGLLGSGPTIEPRVESARDSSDTLQTWARRLDVGAPPSPRPGPMPSLPLLPPCHSTVSALQRIMAHLEETRASQASNTQRGIPNPQREESNPWYTTIPNNKANCELMERMAALFRWPLYLSDHPPPTCTIASVPISQPILDPALTSRAQDAPPPLAQTTVSVASDDLSMAVNLPLIPAGAHPLLPGLDPI